MALEIETHGSSVEPAAGTEAPIPGSRSSRTERVCKTLLILTSFVKHHNSVQDMAHISEAQVAVILGKIAKFETTFKGNVEQSGETQKGKIRKSKRVGKAKYAVLQVTFNPSTDEFDQQNGEQVGSEYVWPHSTGDQSSVY